MKKLFTLSLCAVIILTTLPFYVLADSIEPYAYPTITSRICTNCGATMQKVSTEYEYPRKTIQSILCPNSPYADESAYHTHIYRQQYDIYECSSCGIWGSIFIETIMYSCSLANRSGQIN